MGSEQSLRASIALSFPLSAVTLSWDINSCCNREMILNHGKCERPGSMYRSHLARERRGNVAENQHRGGMYRSRLAITAAWEELPPAELLCKLYERQKRQAIVRSTRNWKRMR